MLALQHVLDALPPPPTASGARHMRLDDLVARLGAPKDTVQRRLRRLIELKLVRSARRGVFALAPKGIALKNAGRAVPYDPPHRGAGRKPRGPKPPRVVARTLADRLWGALRKLKKARTAELAELALLPNQNAVTTIRECLVVWARYGLVARRRRRLAVWFLIRDLGPRAPRLCHRNTKLWDPNAGAYVEMQA